METLETSRNPSRDERTEGDQQQSEPLAGEPTASTEGLVRHDRGEHGHPGDVRDPDREHQEHEGPRAREAVEAVGEPDPEAGPEVGIAAS